MINLTSYLHQLVTGNDDGSYGDDAEHVMPFILSVYLLHLSFWDDDDENIILGKRHGHGEYKYTDGSKWGNDSIKGEGMSW